MSIYDFTWSRGFDLWWVEFIIIIAALTLICITCCTYVLLVVWHYTDVYVISYVTFRTMIVTCSSLSRPIEVSVLSLRIFANSQGPQGSRPQGHFVFFSRGSLMMGSSRSQIRLHPSYFLRFDFRIVLIFELREEFSFSLPPSPFCKVVWG